MKATLDCLACILTQALRASRVATADPTIQRQVLDETAKKIPGLDMNKSPASISMVAYELTASLTGNEDPYRELKIEQNEQALRIEPELRRIVQESEDRLVTALHIAAVGNVIDLGVQHAGEIDIHATLDQVLREGFAVDHTDAFRESLAHSKDLVFLLDNAGEIVFDKILIEELLQHTSVTAVVKAGPIINDALLADAQQVGLTKICEVIDNGGAFVGSPLDRIPSWFTERLEQADMIVGKGQGNYETVDAFPGDVFLILRAKCEVVARHMGLKYGQVGLISTRVRGSH